MSQLLGQLMRFIPVSIAADITLKMVGKPRPARIDPVEAAALKKANRLSWGQQKAAFQWGQSNSKDAVILMFHGWGGSAAQLAPLASLLNEAGYTVIAVDFTSHGQSPGSKVSFAQMIADVTESYHAFGSQYAAVIGHSAGALSLMAARHLSGLKFTKIACINPPISPYPAVNALKKVLNPPQRVVETCNQRILAQFGGLIERQGDVACYKQLTDEKLLVINDSSDKISDCDDGAEILKQWPDAERVVTDNLGHIGTLQDSLVAESVISFCGSN